MVATGINSDFQLPDFDDAALVDDLALSVSVETEVFFQDAHKYLCKREREYMVTALVRPVWQRH